MEDRLRQQLDFLLEIDRMKNIGRQTYIADASRKENDAEHSFHMAIMAFTLAEYANEPIDVLKTVKMCLMHDLIEIYAGDTYCYDTVGLETKRERELAAADRIYGMLPEEQAKEYKGLWDEFEEIATPEAKFANAMDKIQPLMLNKASNGRSWEEHEVQKEWVMKRNERTHEGSEELWLYAKSIIDDYFDKK